MNRTQNTRMGATLHFNGLQFEPLEKTGLESIGAMSHGFYTRNVRGAHLYRRDGSLEAFIVANSKQGHFVVTAHTTPEGPRYMFSTSSVTEKWLKIDGVGMGDQSDLVRAMYCAEAPSDDLIDQVLAHANSYAMRRLERLTGYSMLIAKQPKTNRGIFLLVGDFGRGAFKAAIAEGQKEGLDTSVLYAYATTGTYSGPGINFTKLDEIELITS